MDLATFIEQFTLALISFGANFLSALAGGGAGLLQLPALLFLGLPFPTALATHKIASVALGLGAGLRHFQEKNLKAKFIAFVLGVGLPGVCLGAQLALFIPSELGARALGLLTFVIGIYSFQRPSLGTNNQLIRTSPFRWFVGGMILFAIAVLNGSLSSGTGLLVTLFLVRWFGFSYSEAIAYTLLLVGLFWNGTGALALGLRGEIKWAWLPILVFGSFIGGYAGAQLSISKGSRFVKRAFEALTLLMGVSLIFRSFS